MIATVNEKRQISVPAVICDQLGIEPGAQLDLRIKEGRLEAVKVDAEKTSAPINSLKHLYTPERNVEELTIQQGCSSAVPDDFPK